MPRLYLKSAAKLRITSPVPHPTSTEQHLRRYETTEMAHTFSSTWRIQMSNPASAIETALALFCFTVSLVYFKPYVRALPCMRSTWRTRRRSVKGKQTRVHKAEMLTLACTLRRLPRFDLRRTASHHPVEDTRERKASLRLPQQLFITSRVLLRPLLPKGKLAMFLK